MIRQQEWWQTRTLSEVPATLDFTNLLVCASFKITLRPCISKICSVNWRRIKLSNSLYVFGKYSITSALLLRKQVLQSRSLPTSLRSVLDWQNLRDLWASGASIWAFCVVVSCCTNNDFSGKNSLQKQNFWFWKELSSFSQQNLLSLFSVWFYLSWRKKYDAQLRMSVKFWCSGKNWKIVPFVQNLYFQMFSNWALEC